MIFIDRPLIKFKGKIACHLFSDSLDDSELHEFAKRLGLKRHWFQEPINRPHHRHYDIIGRKKISLAITLGAKEISYIEAVKIWKSKVVT